MERTATIARSLAVTIVAVFIVFLIRYLLDPFLQDNAPFVLFYGAILFSAWYGGWPYGVMATVMAAGLSVHFLIEPRRAFDIHDDVEMVSLAVHAFTSGFGILLIEQLRRAKRNARHEVLIRKEAEEALRRSEARLLEAQKHLRSHADNLEGRVAERTEAITRSLHFLEEFLYSMAHDLRAPVRAVKGLTEALVEDYAANLDDTAKDYGYRISVACERMDRLIVELLEYGRLFHAPLELKPVRLQALIQTVVAEFDEDIAQRQATLKIERIPQMVVANEVALKQILRNLVSNSIKFTPLERRPEIRLWSEERQGRIALCVEDNGLGIPQDYISRIFKPFQRLHTQDEIPGVGMGLAIARLAAERMNAELTVSSTPGHGSCFCLELESVSKQKAPLPGKSHNHQPAEALFH